MDKINKQQNLKQVLYNLGGYYLIPHELLHVLAYKIIKKPCKYEWGDYKVQSLEAKNRKEKVFVLLFPFGVCWGIGFAIYFLWLLLAISAQMPPELYFFQGPKWHFTLPFIATLFIIYGGTAHQDLIDAFGWLFIYKTQYDSDKPQTPNSKLMY